MKHSKSSILKAYKRLTDTSIEVNAMLEEVNESINNLLKQADGASVFIGNGCYCLADGESIVSTFGNFIDLYFVLQKKQLSKWTPDPDLTPQEKAEDLDTIRHFRRGEITMANLCASLHSTANAPFFRVHLEPTIEEMADIYDTQRFSISDTDTAVIVTYGSKGLISISKQAPDANPDN